MAKLISRKAAQERMIKSVAPLEPVVLAIREAAGLALAEEVSADRDLPPFDRAAMDGYALKAADTAAAPVTLKVIGELVPGREPTIQINSGEAARIMTGAPLPPGADAVQMIEVCTERDGLVEIGEAVEAGQNVAPRGEDAVAGDVMLRRSTVVTPAVAAVLASVGAAEVRVFRRPLVRIIATGDEVVPPDASPSPAQIRNANGPALAARLRMAGAVADDLGIAGDSREALETAVAKIEDADALVITGGVSKGRYDLVKDVLARAGAETIFSGIAIKPGKPTTFAILRGKPVFGLPGNPVSCLVAAELLVVPALRAMMGYQQPLPAVMRAELLGPIKADPARTAFHPARLGWRDGVPTAGPLSFHGSGDFADFALADLLVEVPPARDLEPHEIVDIILLNISIGGTVAR